MSTIVQVAQQGPGPAARDDDAGSADRSHWNQDWRQAFEQARQVDYADWFGGGVPAPAASPRAAAVSVHGTAAPAAGNPVPAAAHALLAASLRQQLRAPQPTGGASVESAPPPAPADVAAAPGVAHAEGVDAAAAPVATTAPGAAACTAGAGAGAAAPANPQAPTRGPTREVADPARAGATSQAGVADIGTVAAVMEALAAQPRTAAVVAAVDALAVSTAVPPPAANMLPASTPAPTVGAEPAAAVLEAQSEETDRAASPPPVAPAAASTGSDDAPRVHAEWTADGVKVWLGMTEDPALPGRLEALLAQLQPMLAAHGEPLAELFCNGRSVWRATERGDDVPAARRPHDPDSVSLVSDPDLQEAR